MSKTTTASTTFAPDLNDCSFAAVQYELSIDPDARICRLSNEATCALLAEYQRQLAAADFVIVRRKDLSYLRRHHQPIMSDDVAGNGALKRTSAILAANKENR